MATSGGSRRVARLKARSQAKSDAHATIARKALGDSRVSTDEQAEHGHSLENQERAGRAFAESQGDEVVDIIADAGASGTRRPAERDGFARGLAHAEAGAFSILLVWKFDRLASPMRSRP